MGIACCVVLPLKDRLRAGVNAYLRSTLSASLLPPHPLCAGLTHNSAASQTPCHGPPPTRKRHVQSAPWVPLWAGLTHNTAAHHPPACCHLTPVCRPRPYVSSTLTACLLSPHPCAQASPTPQPHLKHPFHVYSTPNPCAHAAPVSQEHPDRLLVAAPHRKVQRLQTRLVAEGNIPGRATAG